MHASAAVALGTLLIAIPGQHARAQDVCADDVQRLCPELAPGSGRVARCLREKQESVSPACRAKLDEDALRTRKMVEAFGRACRGDVDQYCPDIEPGQGRVLGCLAQHQLTVSPPCQDELGRISTARAQVVAVREACAAEAKELCQGVPPRAGPLLECLQANEARLSGGCSAADLRRAVDAALLVDGIEEVSRQDRVQEALQVLQGLDSVAFSRSQILLQFDSYQAPPGAASASRILFNPQVVFGDRYQYALQVKVPVKTVYPSSASTPVKSGLGEITTAFAWNVASHGQIRHFLSLGVQLETASDKVLGAPWAVQPAYAVAMGLARWCSATTQVVWVRSLGSSGYPETNLLLLEPILVANLPGRSFVSLDTRLGWNLVDGSFLPLLKGVTGVFLDRKKSVSVAAWVQAPLTDSAAARAYDYEVGLGLAYFFER
jgi:hypothetical protein